MVNGSLGSRETETSAVKMGKDNKEHKESKESKTVDNYEARMPAVLPFAKPLASKKLNKKVLKTVKKASKAKNVKRGVKEVVKALRKGEKGLVVIAGDISPADVISHIPVLCEDHSVPYIFIPSKQDLGAAGATKRPTSVVFIVPGSNKKKDGKNKEEEYKESFNEVVKEVQAL
ncbi:Nhp2 [Saccharomyces cerevisiae]|nr:Nhp2 [Saccharomyces cerevisiae]CAA40885.1 high mobility group-like nuclear protein 2 [Saccharomyces cerevisiae]CAA67483.1 high-mobility-group-like protein [Saccharomyces cerevisiae]CAA98786.1 NHP2 [Saccharomyces cerevisiae]CAI4314649.1 CBK_G0006880.mRNA.1.CDS.1 [Saccharomyces cerevisiae]